MNKKTNTRLLEQQNRYIMWLVKTTKQSEYSNQLLCHPNTAECSDNEQLTLRLLERLLQYIGFELKMGANSKKNGYGHKPSYQVYTSVAG